MTIHTRFGSEIEVIGKDPRWPDVPWLAVRYKDPARGSIRWASVADMKADGGINEIAVAAAASPDMVDKDGTPQLAGPRLPEDLKAEDEEA